MIKKLKNWLKPKTTTLNKDKLYYLASPYTNSCKQIEKDRLNKITKVAGLLLKKDIKGIYPISSSAKISEVLDMGTSFEYWSELDFLYVEKSDGLIVANLPGWQKSVGVTAEIEHAKKLGKPVFILNTKDLLTNNKLNVRKVA